MKFFISILSSLILIIAYSKADDNLFLRGTLKNIENNTAIIDIKSGSCPGKRKFRLPGNINLESLKEKKNKNIFLYIKENNCSNPNKIYTIIEVK
ncbi:hypothetical protein [Persephonella sp. KM09-Lau-8]|uniref:hypothetical protein n=1 Tax=Persephonella sp. KM09-Lau-8 TaxID=1158345 RepID=UPI0004950569|nr:hypothetical protein [Persephonella sp. KM09-Lau-8]